MKRLATTLSALAALAIAGRASATEFRRPFDPSIGLGYGYDHNGGGAGCEDYNCGTKCYDGHRGNDYPLPFGTDVLAAANGTVTFVNNGCANVGFLGSTCGGGAGNYVRIQHADGKVTVYMHLALNSILVGVGDNVSCGQKIADSASSGNSSGNHLHFEPRVSNVANDPYAGPCSGSVSFWVGQGAYGGVTSATCESVCACSPGQVETTGCGNCGTHTRTCQGNCQWGPFGSCDGQGVCAPGQTESMPCGDCGATTRTCSGSCEWGGYGGCGGPDPDGGNQVCQAASSPPCADGRVRCVEGWLECKSVYEPQPETCDGLDNDCNDLVDDGHPATMSDPPPDFAATLVDVSYPQALRAGERGLVWAEFRNDGKAAWPKGGVWFRALGHEGGASALYAPGAWPAYDVTTVLDRPVLPGEKGRFSFEATAPSTPGAEVVEVFQLAQAGGAPIRCPRADIEVKIRVLPALDGAGGGGGADAAPPEGRAEGCAAGGTSDTRGSAAGALLLAMAALLARSRRR